MTTRKPHAESRAQMRHGIITEGMRLLEQHGHYGLSIREVARSMGVAPSALYRHVKNRDDLLTLLLVESFDRIATHVEGEVASVRQPEKRLQTIAHAIADWAHDHPQQWALMYGTPIPNYAAPANLTTEPGTRTLTLFIRTFDDLGLGAPAPAPGLQEELARGAHDLSLEPSPEQAAGAVLAWTSLIGLVNAIQFGHLGPEFTQMGSDLVDLWAKNLLHGHSGRTL